MNELTTLIELNAYFFLVVTISVILLLLISFACLLIKNYSLNKKYKPIISFDKEIEKKEKDIIKIDNKIETLNSKYEKALNIFHELESNILIYQDDLELIDYGVYKPQFDFDTSEKYKEKLNKIVEEQKKLIKGKKAAIAHTDWIVSGSKSKGKTLNNKAVKLTLRAFNGECNSSIAKVKWNNVENIEKRIRKAFDAINKLNTSSDVVINKDYLKLKILELKLTYEYERKKYEENEDQKRIKAQMREEERATKEIETAKKEAQKEEIRYQKALEKAQKELEKATGQKISKLNDQVDRLKQELANAKLAKEKAVSRAEFTKSGHIYVISNIGSFGDGIYKIGMTRRLVPLERVNELGSASVPFKFDVHAMIFSENAPELENKIHEELSSSQVNLVNHRKEFFRVDLNQIEEIVNKHHSVKIEFTKLAEAQEYRETLAIQKALNREQIEHKTKIFPEKLIDLFEN